MTDPIHHSSDDELDHLGIPTKKRADSDPKCAVIPPQSAQLFDQLSRKRQGCGNGVAHISEHGSIPMLLRESPFFF